MRAGPFSTAQSGPSSGPYTIDPLAQPRQVPVLADGGADQDTSPHDRVAVAATLRRSHHPLAPCGQD
jgi:hypothetical protein